MKQSYIWVLVGLALLAVVVGFYFYYFQPAKSAPAGPVAPFGSAPAKVIPAIKPPEINPIEKTNPFKNTYKNPFE